MSEKINYSIEKFGLWWAFMRRIEFFHLIPHGLWVLFSTMCLGSDIDYRIQLKKLFLEKIGYSFLKQEDGRKMKKS